ncbi:hypothetical protein [Curtobacterium sp. MCPF17_003]|uniref:hypothetical protein n=1 Tax=Curtobacterium sp. MCPF17_003 TaxID=2175637 RepID=UPI0011B3FA16|nr:hypothetical protein [Curtobacterium sp. MCPF17_003]
MNLEAVRIGVEAKAGSVAEGEPADPSVRFLPMMNPDEVEPSATSSPRWTNLLSSLVGSDPAR